jgi:hypothetical protein
MNYFFQKLLLKTLPSPVRKCVKAVSFGAVDIAGRYVSDGTPESQVLAEMGCLAKE